MIAKDQQRRLKTHQITGGDPTYVHKIRDDDDQRYIRNAGAADTKGPSAITTVAAVPDKEIYSQPQAVDHLAN